MPGCPPGRRLCSSIAIKPYRLVSYWCVCAPIASVPLAVQVLLWGQVAGKQPPGPAALSVVPGSQ